MKHVVSMFVLVALTINCTYTLNHYVIYEETQPITISDRVGEMIDSEEREQFELFSGIDNFESATFYEIEGGGLEARIITQNTKLIAVNRDYRALMILIDYFNRYEEIQQSRYIFEHRWEIIGYDDLGFPITKAELNRVRRGGLAGLSPYIGMITGFVVGYSSSILLSIVTGIGGFGSELVCGGLGAWIGYRVNRDKAFNAIKEARKPRVIQGHMGSGLTF